MKQIKFLPLISLLLLLFLSAPAQDVYKTKTGKKYHSENCSYLSKSKIKITLEEAIAKGLGPCSRCNPPILQSSSQNLNETTVKPKTQQTSTQCAAITKKGTRCKRNAKAGSIYCWQHGR